MSLFKYAACGTYLDETIVSTIEILKDRPSWSRCCRNMEVVAKYHVHSGGTIELIYTQHYAPTIMAFSRDFWTLRYTSVLDDGSFVVCEKSASGSDAAPSSPASLEFVRGRMLASGYLVRPCEGGSTIYLVDHLDLEASSAPEVVRPLYESSEIVAKTMTVCVTGSSLVRFLTVPMSWDANGLRCSPPSIKSLCARLVMGIEAHWELSAHRKLGLSSSRGLQEWSGFTGSSLICWEASNTMGQELALAASFRHLAGRYGRLYAGYCVHALCCTSFVNYEVTLQMPLERTRKHKLKVHAELRRSTGSRYARALNYIEHVANETNGKQAHDCREDPTFLRSFSQRLSRGFNDAITGFAEDGWTLMNADASNDVIMSINRTKIFGANENYDSVICVKASLLLQNVFPGSLVSLLKERRSAWMNFDFADHSVASGACYGYPGFNTHNLSENTVLLGHTNLDDEVLEVIRFERLGDCRLNVSSRDLYYLQVSNGMEDTDFGACSELIFAPIDRNIPNDAVLFSSGFRIYFLGSNTVEFNLNIYRDGQGTNMNVQAATSHSHSMLILAFQFPFESHREDEVAAMARKYVQHVISSVKNISQEIMASGSNPEINSIEANPTMELQITPESTYAANLANLICQSYRSIFGAEILGFNCQNSVLELIQHHQYAILCFSFSSVPVCLHANQTGLNMLETTLDKLQTLTMDKLLGVADNVSLSILLPAIIEQGYVILPPGCYLSEMNCGIAYEQAVVWKVQGADGSIQFLALAFINWSFI
ncbi:hypothetical protein BUALT_Bualt01G0121000 [Buddleja alternifolia]|uniref:START domain-containing protein n=1 Tax=Buddleja alternifolia TaxID=168488 RepID=A0AAV6Y7Y2_9LAMI|nr:hypothetical protein BUALT_Bualt01G0121000 [Buddleja alternifolia]